MRLKLLLPSITLLDEPVQRIVAEADNGSFCLLPRHADFVAALAPGILSYRAACGAERLVAVADGVLVKCHDEVLVSVRDAIAGTSLDRLRATVEQRFRYVDEQAKTARSALARLEAGVVRRFVELRWG